MIGKRLFNVMLYVLFNVWLLCYWLVVLCFVVALANKWLAPELKNLDWDGFAITGGVLLVLFVINLAALKRRAKADKQKEVL